MASLPSGNRDHFTRGYFESPQIVPDLPFQFPEPLLLPPHQIHFVHRHNDPGHPEK